MQVIATAGHVDHGKSALIRALTGTDPDRWAEEHERGLTLDLGFAWLQLPSGQQVSFVDVPGHERFIANMLAGLGPAPVVCFVVAVDQGWQAQSSEHRDAVAALGISSGVIVLTRTDLAPERVDTVLDQVRHELAHTGLAQAPAVSVSSVTGQGVAELVTTLDQVVGELPAPTSPRTGRRRLWVDRAFSLAGAGTIVTGTWEAGTLYEDEELELLGHDGQVRPVRVRGLQCHGRAVPQIGPVSRVAVNVRGVDVADIARGDALLSPSQWWFTDVLDVVRTTGAGFTEMVQDVTIHVGTAAINGRCRPLDDDSARLTLTRALPLGVGDRMVIRGTGSQRILGGAQVADVHPPPLTRRGAAGHRATELSQHGVAGALHREVLRYGAVPVEIVQKKGIELPQPLPQQVDLVGQWLVHVPAMDRWRVTLTQAVKRHVQDHPLTSGLPQKAAADQIGLPSLSLLSQVIDPHAVVLTEGLLRLKDADTGLGDVEEAVLILEQRWKDTPFQAPDAHDLAELGLGPRQLAAAEQRGRLIRVAEGVVLSTRAPAQAMQILVGLPQPFTTSAARQALGTTRRTAIPLLELLDSRGWTRRLDAGHREVVRSDA